MPSDDAIIAVDGPAIQARLNAGMVELRTQIHASRDVIYREVDGQIVAVKVISPEREQEASRLAAAIAAEIRQRNIS